MNTAPMRAITEEEIDRFQRDGVIHLPGVFDRDWVERMRQAIDDAYGQGEHFYKLNPEGTDGLFYYNLYVWRFNDDFRALAFDSPAPDAAASLMRTKRVTLISDVIFHKAPQSDHATPWHQDQPYWYFDGRQAIGMWISLDSVTLESGSVEYIRGSHNWNKWYDPANFDVTGNMKEFTGTESDALREKIDSKESDNFLPTPDFENTRGDYDIVHFDTEPGDIVVNHLLTVHSAPGNRTDNPRRAIAFRFVGDDATYAVRKADFRLKPPADPKLEPGAPFPPGHDLFPQVWPRA